MVALILQSKIIVIMTISEHDSMVFEIIMFQSKTIVFHWKTILELTSFSSPAAATAAEASFESSREKSAFLDWARARACCKFIISNTKRITFNAEFNILNTKLRNRACCFALASCIK